MTIMSIILPISAIAVLFAVMVLGIQMGKLIAEREANELNPVMAYGFLEKDQIWNRIRVDEQGHVLCHKE